MSYLAKVHFTAMNSSHPKLVESILDCSLKRAFFRDPLFKVCTRRMSLLRSDVVLAIFSDAVLYCDV